MDLSAVTKLPPKKLALVVGGGIGAGLLWRRYKGKSATATAVAAVPQDVAPQYAQGAADGNSLLGSSTASRDVGQGTITLPVTKSIITVGGVDYYIDANGVTTPVGGSNGTSTPPVAYPSDPSNTFGMSPAEYARWVATAGGAIPNNGAVVRSPATPSTIANLANQAPTSTRGTP